MNKLLALIGLIIVILGLYLYMGYYNISAMKPHMNFIDGIFQEIKYNSVSHHTEDIIKPAVSRQDIMKAGFEHYEAMCVHCHGAPGITETELQKGLYPKPPSFPDGLNEELGIEQIYWITKNGIKMSGMPGFGTDHSEDELWAIAGFVYELRNIPEDRYNELKRSLSAEDRDHTHGEEHDHGETEKESGETNPEQNGVNKN